jgi:hypothetical protein
MSKKLLIVIALLLPPLIVVAVTYRTLMARADAAQQTSAPGADVPAPAHWVAFTASAERVSSTSKLRGEFYRTSDGSTRSQWRRSDNALRSVNILNVAQGTYYEFGRNGEWCSHPMRLGPNGYHPPKMRTTNANLTPLNETVEGFAVYRLSGPSPVIETVAPELNFFPIVLTNALGGSQQRYFDIKIGEPAAELFLPPAAASVTAHINLMGIVFVDHSKGERELTLDDIRIHK